MASQPTVTIIAATFHRAIADEMITAAKQAIQQAGANVASEIEVPGSYELPLTAKTVLDQGKSDVIVILAYIEKGETLHGEVMGRVVHRALVDLQLQYNKPIGLGIIGPGATVEQAKVRAKGSATSAVKAAIAVHQIISESRAQ